MDPRDDRADNCNNYDCDGADSLEAGTRDDSPAPDQRLQRKRGGSLKSETLCDCFLLLFYY